MIRFLFILLSFCLPNLAGSTIHEIHSIDEIKTHVLEMEETTWVVFDVDYTLTIPLEPAFQKGAVKQHKGIYKNILESLTDKEKELFPTAFISQSPSQLLEPSIIEWLNELKQKNIKLLAFTASVVGPCGTIDHFENWRIFELKRLNIDFSSSFPNLRETVFENLETCRGRFPLFKEGVLFTNGERNSKGQVFRTFLSLTDCRPSKVIFVDDDRKNIDSMSAVLGELNIELIGFHYRRAESILSEDISEEEVKATWSDVAHFLR